jgi:hypothetical protein
MGYLQCCENQRFYVGVALDRRLTVAVHPQQHAYM